MTRALVLYLDERACALADRARQCDYRRPSCLRCVQAGFQCGGYDDATRFILYQADHPEGHSKLQDEHVQTPRAGSIGLLLPPTLRNAALRSAYFNAAWRSLHPIEGRTFSHGWLPNLQAVHNAQSPLHSAFAAVSLARVGQQRRDNRLVQQSHVAYQRAVFGIQKQLALQTKAPDDELIASVLMLAVFEVRMSCV